MKSRHPTPVELVKTVGGSFCAELGIDVRSGADAEIFKWFLAAILFGARISTAIAIKTYREFVREGLVSPKRISARGWDGLIAVLDRGGYARYDFRTASKLLQVCNTLLERYGGSLNRLHREASNPHDLEQRLKALSKGIGEVTTGIFLRELRGIWQKAEPLPSDRAIIAAKSLGFISGSLTNRERALKIMKDRWIQTGGAASQFPDFEAALVRWTLSKGKIRSEIVSNHHSSVGRT
jgi:hypothetical protein